MDAILVSGYFIVDYIALPRLCRIKILGNKIKLGSFKGSEHIHEKRDGKKVQVGKGANRKRFLLRKPR